MCIQAKESNWGNKIIGFLSRWHAPIPAAQRSQKSRVPSPLDMPIGTRVIVTLGDGTRCYGEFRDAAPDGGYAVRLDVETGCLMSFRRVDVE
jgi:hypothetical protein